MEEQTRDIRLPLRFIAWCRRREWLLGLPGVALAQRLLLGRHRVLARREYFPAVMRLIDRAPTKDLEMYRKELLENALLRRNYEGAIESGRLARKYARYEQRFGNEANIVNYYAVLRELRPSTVVETGTATGSMSSWILAALEANGHGTLVSIDLPAVKGQLAMGITVAPDEVGFLIPAEYRHRWEYLAGDAKVLLPRLLTERRVDVFVHDSLHTRTHMLFEYNVARCLMRPGTILMSDDILWNCAYFEFLRAHRLRGLGCIANPNLGLTVNEFDPYERRVGTDAVSV